MQICYKCQVPGKGPLRHAEHTYLARFSGGNGCPTRRVPRTLPPPPPHTPTPVPHAPSAVVLAAPDPSSRSSLVTSHHPAPASRAEHPQMQPPLTRLYQWAARTHLPRPKTVTDTTRASLQLHSWPATPRKGATWENLSPVKMTLPRWTGVP